jgi:succinate-semialdehyde dehydrogenase/glutarate-semialdehyde dehydrogenase
VAYVSTNPYSNEIVATFPYATEDEIDDVLDRAQCAFESWSRMPVADRAAIFARAAELLRERTEELGALVTLEMGKLLSEANMEAAMMAAPIFDWVAGNAEEVLRPKRMAGQLGPQEIVIRPEAQGIVYSVQPWNVPYYQATRGFAPAAISGNVVILKHSSIVPQSAQAIVDLLSEAGLPDGVWQNVRATHEQSDRIIADPRVRAVTLTGSSAVGSHVAAQSGKALRKTVLELGGSDAFVVLPDADLDEVVKGAMIRCFIGGQTCVSPKRMIIVESLYEEFLRRFTEALGYLRPGDPADPATTYAPVASQAAADDLRAQIDRAVAAGAVATPVGEPIPDTGAFVQPTVLTEVTADNPAFYEEFFGLVPIVFRVPDEEAAIALANDSLYGLSGSVWGRDVTRAYEVAARLDTGNVAINQTFPAGGPAQPFGGVKASGYGRELGPEGILEFCNMKAITFPVGVEASTLL